MKYLNESFEEFVNEMALSPEDKKARRNERRHAKRFGITLPPLSSAQKSAKTTKASQLTPEELLAAVIDASPSRRIEWDQHGTSFYGQTDDRGPRTDHGGGDDGEDWMDDEQIRDAAAPYYRKWKGPMAQMEKDLAKKGITATVRMDYGEKGHIALDVNIQQ